jgi:UDP-N-acetyl-D-glucosamine dehydrogenase
VIDYSEKLVAKIKNKKARIFLYGVGYVGQAIGLGSSAAGYQTLGLSRSKSRIDRINKLAIDKFKATSDASKMQEADVIVICVPTPVFENKKPDLRPLKKSLTVTKKYLKKGQLVVIESSVGTGTTRNFALPILEQSGLVAEQDFFLAFSPERIDPGNKKYIFRNIPKVVAGYGEKSHRLSMEFYGRIVDRAIPVSSLEAAEAVKLLENTFRLVNISFINEFADYVRARGLDIEEIISAAQTKPFGFMAHYPGPGIGGHCIPVDPYYLVEDAARRGIALKSVEVAGRINDSRPRKVVSRAVEILKRTNGKKHKNNILLIGLAYKKNIEDIRESASLKIWKLLKKKGHSVSYHDPHVPRVNGSISSKLSSKVISKHDLIIIATDHQKVDYDKLVKHKTPILDTRKVFNGNRKSHVFDL